MIDTIRGYINLEDYKYLNFNHLTSNKSKSKNDEGYSQSFNIKNFKVTITFNNRNKPMRLYFNGSLTKYYLNNNLANLDWDDISNAVESLSKEVGVDLNKAILTRFDYGFNFTLKHQVHNYTSCLVDFPRLERIRYKDSITFDSKSGGNSFIFYDKIKELKSHRTNNTTGIPIEYLKHNVLRYEMRLSNLHKQEIKAGRFILEDLFDNTVQKKLHELWVNGYEQITKKPFNLDPLYLLNTNNGLYKYLSYQGTERLGYEKIIDIISNETLNVKNQSVKRSRMKKTIKELMINVKENTLEENLITELDNKIKSIEEFI